MTGQPTEVTPDSFLLSGAAKSLTLDSVRVMSEDEAFATFKSIRWASNNGMPQCPNCGSMDHYALRVRHRCWVCKGCKHQFSATSGTIFSSRKLSFHDMLVSVVVFLGAEPIKSCAKAALKSFAVANATLEDSANALGRSPTSLIHYARELKIKLPQAWGGRSPRKLKIVREPRVEIAYPYIIKPRAEHAELIEINNLIPKSIAGDMRADMCQEIMLAILEGRTSLNLLRARKDNTTFFIKKFYRDNFEQSGYAVSFDNQVDSRGYDEIASSIAAKEWPFSERNSRGRYGNLLRTFNAPTQEEDVFRSQVRRKQIALHDSGQMLSFDEVEEMMREP